LPASGTHSLQRVGNLLDAVRDAAAVGFELGFARPARPDAPAQPRHLDAMPGEARQPVVQLRQLHLQAAFARPRARCKDVQNELGPVDDLGVYGLFEVALLGGREVVVEDHDLGAARSHGGRNLFDFSPADEGGGVQSRARLQQRFGHLGAGAGG
jgi:hypothetical protein